MSSNNEITTNERGNRPPLFRKMNYILMGVGALLLLIGYIVFALIYWPLNKELKRRNEINYNSVDGRK